MEFMNVIKTRRSSRNFKTDPIPDDVLDDIIEAGRLSPSAGNGQNWYFGVIRNKVQIGQLAVAAGKQLWIASAPAVIAVCTRLDWDISTLPEDDFSLEVNRVRFTPEFIEYVRRYPNQKAVSTLFLNSASFIPGEQMFLAAVNHGLGACWIGYLDIDEVNKVLDLPHDVVCLNLIPIGYPAEKPLERARKSVQEIVFYDSWSGK